MRKKVLLYYKNLETVHLTKDVCQIPYTIAYINKLDFAILTNNFSLKSFNVYKEIFNDFIDKSNIFIINKKNNFIRFLNEVIFFIKMINKFKLLYLYLYEFNMNYSTFFIIFIFKLLNKKSKVLLRFETDLKYLDHRKFFNLNFIKRILYIFLIKNIDYFGIIDWNGFTGIKKLYPFNKYLPHKILYYQPNGFSSSLIFKFIDKINDFESRKNYIVLSGRLDDPVKGLDVFLKAIKNLNIKNWKIKIVGGDKDKILKIVRDTLDHHNCGTIDILGKIHYKDLYNLLNNSKIYVLSSYFDGMPNAVVEAMALGCCIVSANHYGMQILLENGRIGKLFNVGDYNELSTILINLIENKNELLKYHIYSLEKSWKELSWEKIVSGIKIN